MTVMGASCLATAVALVLGLAASLPAFQTDHAVLTRATIEAMQAPAPSARRYGLGYQVRRKDGLTIVGHGGANIGWIAHLALVPASGDGLIVLTNGTNGGAVVAAVESAWLASLRE